MSWDFYTSTMPVAKKDYPCDAWVWISNANLSDDDFEEEDREIIFKAKSEGYKILKGTKYSKTKGMFNGEFTTFRSRIDLDDICKKYDLYEE
jgi:hypothetical protein